MRTYTPYQEKLAVELWNKFYGPGTEVWVRIGEDEIKATTSGWAEHQNKTTAVIGVTGVPYKVRLRKVRPVTLNLTPLAGPALPLEDLEDRCPGPL